MSNLDSIFKSRDITLLTKVRLVKTMFFPVVRYVCESWTVKKAEHRRTDAFELWCWRRLESPLDCKIQPVHSEGDQPWVFIEGLMLKLKLQYFGPLMRRVDSREKTLILEGIRARRGEGNGTPLQYSCLENPMDRGAWKAAVHGVARSQTRLSDFTFTFHFHALEKEMATHSSVLARRIPGTGEPGGLPSLGLHRIGHD